MSTKSNLTFVSPPRKELALPKRLVRSVDEVRKGSIIGKEPFFYIDELIYVLGALRTTLLGLYKSKALSFCLL